MAFCCSQVLYVYANQTYQVFFHHKICEGQTVVLQGRDEMGTIQTYTYSTNAQETKHFYTEDGQDSIVDVLIEVGKPEKKEIKETKCNEYYWHGERYTESGTHTWHGKTEYGCDLTETLLLTIFKPVTGPTVEITICPEILPYIWHGQTIEKDGTYTATLQAANGCDSIAKLKIKIESPCDNLFLPYETSLLTPEQQELSPERLAYPTEMKEIIKNEIKFQCEGQLEEPTTPFVFSVSPSTKVVFSPGNLQFNAAKGSHQCADGTTQQGTWRFAEHQWDYVGDAENGNVYENGVKCNNELISSTYNGWIDLFGWGTSGWNSGANSYKPYETSQSYEDYYPGGYDNTDLTGTYAKADWGVYNQIGDVSPGTWRTMSKDEWLYLFHERKDAEKLFALGTVNGVPGAIILPDDWITPSGITFTPSTDKGLVWKDSYYIESGGDHYSDNVYTAVQWNKMESGGAVFLPTAGYRDGTKVKNALTFGHYWSTSYGSSTLSYYLGFYTYSLGPLDGSYRYFGVSVRLVSDVK